jgi:hypothetical protein
MFDFSPQTFGYYLKQYPEMLRRVEYRQIVTLVSFAVILSAHVAYAFGTRLPDIVRVSVYLFTNAQLSALDVFLTALGVTGFAFLLALAVTPWWVNHRSRNMTEETVQTVLKIPLLERTPLMLQDLLVSYVFGLIKLEIFIVVPLALFGIEKEHLLQFPTELYILIVSALLLIVGRFVTQLATRSYFLYATGIVAAPLSILFSGSLDFFHMELKRRLIRRYAKLNQRLPDIVRRLEAAASNACERLLIDLIAHYGLTDEEMLGSRRLPGIKPAHFNAANSTLNLHFFDLKARKVDTLNLPLDGETTNLFVECSKDLASDEQIYKMSKWALWSKVRDLASRAGIANPWPITTFRLRGHFMIYASKKLPEDIVTQLRSKKQF